MTVHYITKLCGESSPSRSKDINKVTCFYCLVALTRDHGQMCPCAPCKRVKSL